MSRKECMISVMADIIGNSGAFDGDRLNDPDVWRQFIQAVLNLMDNYPDEEMHLVLNTIDREEFQTWIDDPIFWDGVNSELDRRAEVLLTLLPSDQTGHC